MMIRRIVVTGAVLLSLAACGSATDSVTFKAPSNFTPKASIGPFMQLWTTADKRSGLLLMQIPAQVSLDDMLSKSTVKDAEVISKRKITICGNQPAIYAEMTGSTSAISVGDSSGPTVTASSTTEAKGYVDFLGTNVNGHTYMAMYIRERNAPADAAAVAAIHDVCAK